MPYFETSVTLARPVAEVFDFFRRPANLLRVSPPELNLSLLEGPELIERGARIVLQARRFGIPQKLASEVTAFEPNALFVDELREGPFRKWVQTHRFETVPTGTRVTFRVDYEPPGGALGLFLTAKTIDQDLRAVFAFRAAKLQEIFG
jgi:ligand-binding SRPBCC domain-containing protein